MVHKIKAVVVEDDGDLRFLYQNKLERHGFEVIVASDGAEGLDVIKRSKPHIVLLDLLMPVMGGVGDAGPLALGRLGQRHTRSDPHQHQQRRSAARASFFKRRPLHSQSPPHASTGCWNRLRGAWHQTFIMV